MDSCRQMDVSWRLQCLHGCLQESTGLVAPQWRAAWCRARAQCQWQPVGQGPHTAGQRLFGGYVILAEA